MTVAISTIIDNRDGNTLHAALERISAGGKELWIASAFFSLDALLLLADTIEQYERVRILFGDEANPRQRKLLLDQLRSASDADLLVQREKQPLLTKLQKMEALFASGRVEARCYTAKKFHAKAYIIKREMFPEQIAVMGSGNFTRQGLLNNIELNALQTTEQTEQLRAWYEERWEEAQADVVTEDVLAEIRRQIELYDPYYLYLKALYAWGQDRQGESSGSKPQMVKHLDEHQRQGYSQALKIIERQGGVMVCDGVGLGKSFIALALMEHFCRVGKRVLLIAPKNILDNSWRYYLEEYLKDFRQPFGSIDAKAMTEFGFDIEKLEGLNVLSVFVNKPFISRAPDAEKSAHEWISGELLRYYRDWRIEFFTEEVFDCMSSGIAHKHAVNRIIARKEGNPKAADAVDTPCTSP